jgi:nuclear GTP-binding protein
LRLAEPQEPEEDNEEEDESSLSVKTSALGQNSRRAFLKDLRKIIESSEVILHVLDARDPIGTKSSAIEEMVLSASGKKLVYVLNKADLVPRDVLVGWLTYLRQSHPAIPFKCNTQTQKGNLGSISSSSSNGKRSLVDLDSNALLSNQTIGSEELLNLLKNYCRVNGTQLKSSIAVGIVGFPNVGKSSLINSLTRTRAVNVSSVPGYTKQIQEVILDKNIRLLDSPGVVFADGDTGSTILRNCVNVDEMTDLISPIEAILERCPASYLMQLYSIPKFQQNDCLSFLSLVARSTGKLKRGGIPNLDAAAKGILHDWNNGKIKYYCKPPVVQTKPTQEAVRREEASGDTKIVTSFGKQIDFDNLDENDIKVLDELSVLDQVAYVGIDRLEYIGGEQTGAGNGEEGNDEDEEENDDMSIGESTSRGGGRSRTTSSASIRVKKSSKSKSTSGSTQEQEVGAVALRGQQKKLLKKAAKDTRRSKTTVDRSKLEDYSFDSDFQY